MPQIGKIYWRFGNTQSSIRTFILSHFLLPSVKKNNWAMFASSHVKYPNLWQTGNFIKTTACNCQVKLQSACTKYPQTVQASKGDNWQNFASLGYLISSNSGCFLWRRDTVRRGNSVRKILLPWIIGVDWKGDNCSLDKKKKKNWSFCKSWV